MIFTKLHLLHFSNNHLFIWQSHVKLYQASGDFTHNTSPSFAAAFFFRQSFSSFLDFPSFFSFAYFLKFSFFLQRESALAPGGRYNARQTMERQETQIGNCKCIKMIPLYHCKCIIDTLYHAFKIVIVSIWYNVPCPRNCKLNQWYIVPCSQKCKCINDTLYHAFKIHWL